VYGAPPDCVRPRLADVRDVDLAGFASAFVDPARRAGTGRGSTRALAAGAGEPPLSWCFELAERLGNAGFGWLVEACCRPSPTGARPIDSALVQDRLAGFETEVTGLRALCRGVVERHDSGAAGPAEASVVKLYYSE
nr:acyl-CoA dehydrogenase family protein [Micromonospora sp. DSM 115978]